MKTVMKAKTFQNFLKRIGNGLVELRKKRGYENITDFTREYNLPMIQYWRIEKGKANVTLKSLAKLLAIHNIQPEDFFCSIKDTLV
jgi:hypothetical protein